MTTRATPRYRDRLPQLGQDTFLADSGLETTVIFQRHRELPYFASFALLDDADGRELLRDYFRTHIEIACRHGAGIVLETPTWRASADWGAKLGYDTAALERVNRASIEMLASLRDDYGPTAPPIVISGNVGPRGDGYIAGSRMSVAEAQRYHASQIDVFSDTAADMVAVFTMNYVEEATGVALAARAAGMPLALSFTLETDGRLPSGQSLQQAISEVESASASHPAYYMINCAHPTHFDALLDSLDAATARRIRGVRANASRRSHAELDVATDLDDGNPLELATEYAALRRKLPRLTVVGGCCGTDHRHVDAIAGALHKPRLRVA